MAQNIKSDAELLSMSALTLAYIGDAVFELAVREHFLGNPKHDNGTLHKTAMCYVSAQAQSKFADMLLSQLDEAERSVYMRGRNAKLSVTKRSEPMIHHKATGFETLIGWLYLSGRRERLEEIIYKILI